MEFPRTNPVPVYVVPLMGDLAAAAEGPVIPGTGAVVTNYRASLRAAPTGASAIVDLYLGDRTTGAREMSPFKTVTITATNYKSDGALSAGVRISPDKFVQAVCTQAGSTLPGTDFVVELFGGSGGGPLPGNTLLLNAKGQLLTHDGSTQVRLSPGSNDDVLTRDSAAADGIKWAPPAEPTSVSGIAFLAGAADPSAGGGVAATKPALYVRSTNGTLWTKTGAADTDWSLV